MPTGKNRIRFKCKICGLKYSHWSVHSQDHAPSPRKCRNCGRQFNPGQTWCYCNWDVEDHFNHPVRVVELRLNYEGGVCTGHCRTFLCFAHDVANMRIPRQFSGGTMPETSLCVVKKHNIQVECIFKLTIQCESCGLSIVLESPPEFSGELTWLCYSCLDSSILEDKCLTEKVC